MTIKEAIAAALDDWKSHWDGEPINLAFFDAATESIDNLVEEAKLEWAEANGIEWNG